MTVAYATAKPVDIPFDVEYLDLSGHIHRREAAQMKGTVLIVDDSAVMRKVILRTLKAGAVDFKGVLEASDGNEALAILRENVVNLIMCDINMPGMTGLELLKQIKQEELAKGVPIVMVTTEGSELQVRQALRNGASGYIRKPFTAENVESNVKPLVAA